MLSFALMYISAKRYSCCAKRFAYYFDKIITGSSFEAFFAGQ